MNSKEIILTNVRLKENVSKKDAIKFLMEYGYAPNIAIGLKLLNTILLNSFTIKLYKKDLFEEYFAFDYDLIESDSDKKLRIYYEERERKTIEAEKWYNTLTEEQKGYIEYLSVGPAMA